MAIDEAKLQQLLDKMLGEAGAAMGIGLVLIGDKCGLYKALAANGPLTSAELASRTGTAARYVREWAAAQAAGGYINFDSATERFSISPEQALILADENGPAFFPAMFELAAAAARDLPKVEAAFRTGEGVGWHEHDPCLFRGTELRDAFGVRMDPGIGRRHGKARTRRARRGCRMRSWRIDHLAGQGVSEVAIFRLRLSRTIARARARAGA